MHLLIILGLWLSLSSSHAGNLISTTRGKVPVAEIQPVVDQMRAADTRGAKPGDIILDYQQQVSRHHFDDKAPKPLFAYVSSNVTSTQTYAAYKLLWPYFNPNVNDPDPLSMAKTVAISAFLHSVMNTQVFYAMWDYLKSKNLASSNYDTMKANLTTMWFGLYSRAKDHNVLGSSGFEHVFVGEWENGDWATVGGQHHWFRYYNLEKAGSINYHGYIEHDADLLATIQYSWANYKKPIGGFLVGNTVEFDFSLFTLCWLTFPDSESCRFKIDDFPIAIVAWRESSNKQLVGSTYPKIV